MIISETVVINSKEYMRTYSDTGFYIERDGEKYCDAVDPLDSGRVYTETSEEIPTEEATIEDYKAALAELGVVLDEES